MDEVRIEPIDVEARGDAALMSFDLIARGRASGIEARQKGFAIVALEDDLLRRISFFSSDEEAAAAFDQL
jgi:hypothetical protein